MLGWSTSAGLYANKPPGVKNWNGLNYELVLEEVSVTRVCLSLVGVGVTFGFSCFFSPFVLPIGLVCAGVTVGVSWCVTFMSDRMSICSPSNSDQNKSTDCRIPSDISEA